MGPVEYIVIDFPGNRFNGDIVPALQELVENGTVNILDLIFIHKDENGEVTSLELDEEPGTDGFADLDGDVGYLLSEDDVAAIAADMPLNSSAALLVWENIWAERFAQAVRDSGGEIMDSGRIPFNIVQAAIDYASGSPA